MKVRTHLGSPDKSAEASNKKALAFNFWILGLDASRKQAHLKSAARGHALLGCTADF